MALTNIRASMYGMYGVKSLTVRCIITPSDEFFGEFELKVRNKNTDTRSLFKLHATNYFE